VAEHVVIVLFDTNPEDQAEALDKIGAYVRTFLSQQPGFIGSTLNKSLDGTRLVHHARWTSEDAFKAAGEKARNHPDMPALMAYKPAGKGYTVWERFGAS
jgi:heme-degrading monooxygenase HmoA